MLSYTKNQLQSDPAQDLTLWEEIGQQRLKKPTPVNHSGTQMYDQAQHHPTVRSRVTTLTSEHLSPFQKVTGKWKGEEETFEVGGMPYCSPSHEQSGRSATPTTGLSYATKLFITILCQFKRYSIIIKLVWGT